MQKVTDPRDGIAKLLEINPRLGQRLCWRAPLGVNEPMICLDIVRGLSPKGNLHFPEGVLLLDLYHAIFFLYAQIVEAIIQFGGRLMRRPVRGSEVGREPDNPGVGTTLRQYTHDHLNFRPKVLGPEVSSLMSDPYPCFRTFSFKFLGMTGGYLRRLHRVL